MPKERAPGPPKAATEETRQSILRAAHSLFMELGYRAVTTRMVAEACGVKQPLLYYHFADKETLYLDVHREQMATSRAALERISARHHEPVPARLHAVICYLRRSSQQNMGVFFHELKHEMSPSMRSTLKDLFLVGIVTPIMSIFEDGVRSGFLRSSTDGGVSPRLATYLLLSAVSSFSGSSDLENDRSNLSTKEAAYSSVDEVVQAIIYGMVARPNET
jgi:AcrR family transcriptional regulator